jgi:hypothetical protein
MLDFALRRTAQHLRPRGYFFDERFARKDVPMDRHRRTLRFNHAIRIGHTFICGLAISVMRSPGSFLTLMGTLVDSVYQQWFRGTELLNHMELVARNGAFIARSE